VSRIVCLLFLGACASPGLPSRPLGASDGNNTQTDGAPSADLAPNEANHDFATHADLGAPIDLATADLTLLPPSCVPRINEVATGLGGVAANEFVELYNPCSDTLDLSGWKLVYRAGTNTASAGSADSTTLFSFSGVTMAHGAFLVYGGSNFAGQSNGALGGGLKDGTGAVGIRDAAGTLVDSVGYGSCDPTSAFIRGSAAPASTTTTSIGRVPDGSDSGNNGVDFRILTAPSPGSPNS
jgi:hypothetical protein